ncbi:hypothetical protein [Bosea sp. (in: a-proteobacteria)]|uniref:hypothetical protein n=1 Tax=Bosea sp. (in: a-proteobacteria) TaxID=1871050 RepID=UPI00261E37A5|nr:hypothetical protein [Bosea sp. (in: a-proteobacteria)]MCO5092427.1 hypothetical protein [Bosea sp. (in: a-proteobacteria)]
MRPPLAGLLAGALVSACSAATTGDLGRPRPNLWSELVAPEAGFWSATMRGEAASYFRLTDDEERLRDRAWRFVMPSHERSVFEGEVSNLAHQRILPVVYQSTDVSDYFRALTSGSFASQASRYNRLAEDANADRLLIGPFRADAGRVVSMDRVRMRTAELSPDVPAEKRGPAEARVVENEGLIFWVCERLDFRIRSYRHALANLVVAMPSREAVKAERAIMALEMEARPLCQMPLNGAFGEGKRPVVYKG